MERHRKAHGAGRQWFLHLGNRRPLTEIEVRFYTIVRLHRSLRDLIEKIPKDAWLPIPYWMEVPADVTESEYTHSQSRPGAAPVRRFVRGGEALRQLPADALRQL